MKRTNRGGTLRPQATRLLLALCVLAPASALTALWTAPSAQPLPNVNLDAYKAGETTFPGATWKQLGDPASAGWDAAGLEEARELFDELESAALVAVHRGVVVASWGETTERYTAQSVRKSLVSALLGTEVDAGKLTLESTLATLGIDEEPPLSTQEKTATVQDLMQTRSGIYRPAIYEHGSWKNRKPEPGAHAPGEQWFYNNWGFNAVETILENSAKQTVADAFLQRIATPLEMQDYSTDDVTVLTQESPTEKMMGNTSIHPAHIFRMSTRDLARFGLLFLEQGKWQEQQILSKAWVSRSFEGNPTGNSPGEEYGLLWWIYTAESPYWETDLTPVYLARGSRGHWVAILPSQNLVVAHQVATGGLDLASQAKRRLNGSPTVGHANIGRLITMIAKAAPKDSSSQGKAGRAKSAPGG